MEEKDNIIEQDILEDNNIDNKIEKSEILLEQDENLVNNNEKKDNLLLRQTTITDPTLLSKLFIDYKNIEKKNSEPINEEEIKDIKRNDISDLDIKNEENYFKIIMAKLDEIKNNSISTFQNSINKFDNCYEKYKIKMLEYINQKAKNIFKIGDKEKKNESLLNYAIQNIFNKIKELTELYDNIIKNIEENFELLNKFLEQNELLDQNNPIEYFLKKNNNDIFNCSVISKFNFEKVNSLEISKINYYKAFLSFLLEEKKSTPIKTFIIKKENFEEGLTFIDENFDSLKQLTIQDIDDNKFIEILNTIKKKKKINGYMLSKLKINNLDLKQVIPKDIIYEIRLNNLQKVKMRKGILNTKLCDFFVSRTECLINLTLEKLNFTNIEFNELMDIFRNHNKILDTLEYLSLRGNSISEVTNIGEPIIFKNLKILDFSKNDIYKYELQQLQLPKLKFLNLSSNNIPTGTLMQTHIKDKDKLALFNDNIFITNCSNNNDIYINYLKDKLPKFDFGLKSLNLCFAYDKEREEHFRKLKLSPTLKISLINLDLSFCGLSTQSITEFLGNNFGLFNLKKLKLNFNNINSDIFKKLCENNILLENLKIIDLSENFIECKKYEENVELINFIEKYQKIEKIKLVNSGFFNMWNINLDSEEYRDLYIKFNNNLKEKKRKFIFMIDNGNNYFIEDEFKNLFYCKDN